MSTTIIETKAKNKSNSKNIASRVFHDKPSVATRRSTNNSIVAQSRIGMTHEVDPVTVTQIIEDTTVGGVKVGNVTILGDPNVNDVDSFRYGKDVKTIKNLLNDKLTVNITLGRETDITSDDYIDHSFELNFFGQNSLFKIFNTKTKQFVAFDDIEGKPKQESFIGKKATQKEGYPYIYNLKNDYRKFRDPAVASQDGAIEVFDVRNTAANSSFSDLQIKGARGLFGVGNWELTQHTTYGKKGSPLVAEKYEIKQSSYDFFEDADESILGKPVSGYVSEGLYKLSPFVEKVNYFNEEYEHLTPNQKSLLLINSSRDDSELGTRFKSRDNGFIMNPFYQLTEQRSFGTDSIAFSGLLKG